MGYFSREASHIGGSLLGMHERMLSLSSDCSLWLILSLSSDHVMNALEGWGMWVARSQSSLLRAAGVAAASAVDEVFLFSLYLKCAVNLERKGKQRPPFV